MFRPVSQVPPNPPPPPPLFPPSSPTYHKKKKKKKEYRRWSGEGHTVPDLAGWNDGCFLSPLLFPSHNQLLNDLVCPCTERPLSSSTHLLCIAADNLRYSLYQPVCLPGHFLVSGKGDVADSTSERLLPPLNGMYVRRTSSAARTTIARGAENTRQ